MPNIKELLSKTPNKTSSIDSLIAECKSNPFIAVKIKEFDLTDDEIVRYYSILNAYATDQQAKANCPGIEACTLPSKYEVSQLKMDGDTLIRVVEYCPCYAKVIKRKRAYKRCDLPAIMLTESAGKLKKLANGKTILNTLALAHKDNNAKWSFVTDEDHIVTKYAASYLNWCADEGKTVAFVEYPKFVDDVKRLEKYQPENFNAEMSLLKNVDVLVINNFGSEYKSDYTRDVILMPVLRERAIKKAETILVSAFEYKDVVSLYSGPTASSKVSAKELGVILSSNVLKPIRVTAGIEEQF